MIHRKPSILRVKEDVVFAKTITSLDVDRLNKSIKLHTNDGRTIKLEVFGGSERSFATGPVSFVERDDMG